MRLINFLFPSWDWPILDANRPWAEYEHCFYAKKMETKGSKGRVAGGSLPNIKGFEYRQAFIFAWRSFANLFDLGGSRKSPQQRFAAFHFNLVCVRGSFERVWGRKKRRTAGLGARRKEGGLGMMLI